MEPQDRKEALRGSARAARRSLDGPARALAVEAIATRLAELPELLDARTVLIYAASPEEVDVSATAQLLRDRGTMTLYPRVQGSELELVEVSDPAELEAGHRGIAEPVGPAIDPVVVDAVLVPGVAFDRRGGRLGQGGGHYDRLLPRLIPAVSIGVAFACQIVPNVPRAAHDAMVDLVVTERSLQRIARPDAV